MLTKTQQVYLDRYQCDTHEVPYFEAGRLSIPADLLLRSKLTGYDKFHRDLLGPLGSQTVHLERERSDGPGWYSLLEKDFRAE